ncbi:hypothetical protein TNCV_500001 [Trichonephila clavipes]|nr:hypothetical protein TNCV_500001 [Trichonephila clavipes]
MFCVVVHLAFGIVVSDDDCCAVRPWLESRRSMDVCKCVVPLRHWGTLNSRLAASPLGNRNPGRSSVKHISGPVRRRSTGPLGPGGLKFITIKSSCPTFPGPESLGAQWIKRHWLRGWATTTTDKV